VGIEGGMAEYDYALPIDLIAQHPVEPRDSARLLVDRGPSAAPEHRHVRDLPDLLRPGDVVVLNDTRVLAARLLLRRASGAHVEVLLVEPLDGTSRRWRALVRNARKLRPPETLLATDDVAVLDVLGRDGDGLFVVEIAGDDPRAVVQAHGRVPLPPYITEPLVDPERYQTVYARRPASVAAPTAGLHLTHSVLARLAARGIDVVRVELVVGLDTFKPVTVDDPTRHRMHREHYAVSPDVLARVRDATRVIAIGTTTVRALESAVRGAPSGRTELFLRRGERFQVVDVLLTNFHLPRTTLLMMIDAFVGPRWRALYELALAEGYRFLSFGDAMLLERR
jgi:S-adenosylmethionine:tRNA ribosyltransferase-isomerase